MDLGVFESNEAAMRLYARHGFVVTGRAENKYRVYGQSMVDVSMSLRLR